MSAQRPCGFILLTSLGRLGGAAGGLCQGREVAGRVEVVGPRASDLSVIFDDDEATKGVGPRVRSEDFPELVDDKVSDHPHAGVEPECHVPPAQRSRPTGTRVDACSSSFSVSLWSSFPRRRSTQNVRSVVEDRNRKTERKRVIMSLVDTGPGDR